MFAGLRASLLRPLGARALSTPPSSSSVPATRPAAANAVASVPPRPVNALASVASDLNPFAAREADPDAWWRGNELAQHYGKPGNQYSGRSFPVKNFSQANMTLAGLLSRSGVAKEHKALEYYEKPSTRRVRLASERNRRRFQENIRRRVQLVQSLRSRK